VVQASASCPCNITKYIFQQGVPGDILMPNILLRSLRATQILSGSLTRVILDHMYVAIRIECWSNYNYFKG
jgi:hypothetical protein